MGGRVQQCHSTRPPRCPNGGLGLDRDDNAALTILAAALVGAASLRPAGQGGTGAVSPERSHFGTDRLSGGVRKRTRHSGWMNQTSPGTSFGECQAMWLFDFPARVSLCAFHLR